MSWPALVKFARDPIWQFVGALLTGIAIVIPYFFRTDELPVLQVVRFGASSLEVFNDPEKRISLLIEGQPVDGKQVVVHYFAAENRGSRQITAKQFLAPITVRSKSSEKKLLALTTPGETPPWKTTFDKGRGLIFLHPPVVNPGDPIIVVAYVWSQVAEEAGNARPEQPLVWSAQIEGAKFNYFDRPTDAPQALTDVAIIYQGSSILLLVGLSLLVLIATIGLGRMGGRLKSRSTRELAIVVFGAVLSFATGEIATHALTRTDPQAQVAIAILILQGVFAIYLLWPKLTRAREL